MLHRVTCTLIAVAVCIVLSSCDIPGEKQAIRDFENDYPQRAVLKCIAGEGNDDAVYFHFEYRDRTSGMHGRSVVLYSRVSDGKWLRYLTGDSQ